MNNFTLTAHAQSNSWLSRSWALCSVGPEPADDTRRSVRRARRYGMVSPPRGLKAAGDGVDGDAMRRMHARVALHLERGLDGCIQVLQRISLRF